ncbi:MAG: hypothetical protein Q8M07_15570, partial [Prosthecobacter sp.]|nr:hypothetical protein [Prosthecobacter sp.]
VRTQLQEAQVSTDRQAAVLQPVEALLEDYRFWQFQARSLGVLATPDSLRCFRLANHLSASVHVADRFHLKPLLRAVVLPQSAYVLALSQKQCRLVQVFADLPAAEIDVEGLPPRAADEVDKSTPEGRANDDSIHESEHQNVLLEKYSTQVDKALQPILRESELPLVLAATGRVADVYRARNTYAHLAPKGIETSPDRMSAAELADAARPILDEIYRGEVEELHTLFELRTGQRRTTSELDVVARAASQGAIEALLVDIDVAIEGKIDEVSGVITLAETSGAGTYDIVDEIAGRAFATGAKVLGVRAGEMPGGGPLAAILRYPI